MPTLFFSGEWHDKTISQYHGGLMSAHCIVHTRIPLFIHTMSYVGAVIFEAEMICMKGLPKFPESLYCVLLLCCALVSILKEIFIIIRVLVAWFTNARAAGAAD